MGVAQIYHLGRWGTPRQDAPPKGEPACNPSPKGMGKPSGCAFDHGC